jgi:glutathione S-transferase
MASPITLYAEPLWDSPFVFTAFVALREKGVPFDVTMVDLAHGAQHAPDYAAKSLTARVPCIAHEDFYLSESSAIVEYLEECFPAPKHVALLPSALRARARARQVLAFLRTDLAHLRQERPSDTLFYQRAQKPLSAAGQASADKLIRVAEALLPADGGPLFGSWSITDADLSFCLHRLLLNGDRVPAHVRAYARTQWQRPSIAAFAALPRPAHP